MSINSSSSAHASLPPLSTSMISFMQRCFNTTGGVASIVTFTVSYTLLLLPLCVFVLHLGFQRWQQHSSTTVSHSDVFTYHMVALELLNVLLFMLLCYGILADLWLMVSVCVCVFTISFGQQTLFHILTCLDRYVAVVYPVTYLRLRKDRGSRIRNASVACVWLLSLAEVGFLYVDDQLLANYYYLGTMTLSLITVSFCSLSVLCVLIRPGPGEGGRDKQKVDQSKLKAFYMILTILGVLLLKYGGNAVLNVLNFSLNLPESEHCILWFMPFWYNLPSSLVLPLFNLHRAGKLPCCK